jgi:hypothetical protein
MKKGSVLVPLCAEDIRSYLVGFDGDEVYLEIEEL